MTAIGSRLEMSHPFVLAASIFAGALVAWLAAEASGLFFPPAALRLMEPLERDRRQECRKNFWYRMFEPLVLGVAQLYAASPIKFDKLDRNLQLTAAGPFTAGEQIGLIVARTLPAAVIAAWLAGVVGRYGVAGMAVVFVAASIGLGWLQIQRVSGKAEQYRRKVRARLPFALELIALMIESGGASILDALRTAADESRDHPLAGQLRRVLRDVDRGKTLPEALTDWSQSYQDEDVAEATLLICTSIARGTPLQGGLRSLADNALSRRFQRLEKAAEECKVHITWPGMVVMLACLLIVSAPFVLAARNELGL